MASRPVFIPENSGQLLVSEVPIEFVWNAGMAPSQKKKNVVALHAAAKISGFGDLLEISSKSEDEVGRRLSAFNLKVKLYDREISLECAYQGSKVFRHGGPYPDIFTLSSLEAKRDPRLKSSGDLIGFSFLGEQYPISPKNVFYDWLYIRALLPHQDWFNNNLSYEAYTDIEFNPAKSVNCQARAFAELISLSNRGLLERAGKDFSFFQSLLPPI